MSGFHDFEVNTIDGKVLPLRVFAGGPVLVVNVASECGLTPQYAGLQALQEKYRKAGLTVLGLPCNQFGGQEPGSEAEIQRFCSTRYGVTFPLSSKIEVNGEGQHPLYAWLKAETGGDDISWNFEKFLIAADGKVIKRYSPRTPPDDAGLLADIQGALG